MKFKDVKREVRITEGYRTVSTTRAAEVGKKVWTDPHNASEILVAEFYLEVAKESTGALSAGAKVYRAADPVFNGMVVGRKAPEAFKNELINKIHGVGLEVDESAFRKFLDELIVRASKGSTRNKAFAYQQPTKKNPKPDFDAKFRLVRIGNGGATLGFQDMDPNRPGVQPIVWRKTGEVEKPERK